MAQVMKKADLEGLINAQVQEVFKSMDKAMAEQIEAQVRKSLEALPTTDYAARFTMRSGNDEPKSVGKSVAGQYLRTLGVAQLALRSGVPINVVDYAKKTWGADAPVTRVLSATDFTAGGAVVPAPVSEEIIELLRPASAVRRMNPTILGMNNGSLTIPKITGGATASYVSENSNLPATGQTWGNIQLVARKLGCIVPMSNDWLRRAVPGADTLVRDDTVAAVAQRSDLAFIRGDGTQDTPRGLKYLMAAANVIPANATVNLANVTTDLGALWLALASNNSRMIRPGYIFSPRTLNYLMNVRDGNGNYAFRAELLTGKLNGYPFSMTTQIPVNLGGGTDESEIYLVDFADFAIGETTGMLIDMSGEAAYWDGSAVQAAFSRDQTVLRVITEHDTALRHDFSAAMLTGVKWA
jgi:HK97 family phage major capsid protein